MTSFFYENPAVTAGKFLKKELKKNHITQEKFAEDFGVDARTVRRWVSKGINSVETIWSIADFFGLENIRDVFSSEDDVPSVFPQKIKNLERTQNGLSGFSFCVKINM